MAFCPVHVIMPFDSLAESAKVGLLGGDARQRLHLHERK